MALCPEGCGSVPGAQKRQSGARGGALGARQSSALALLGNVLSRAHTDGAMVMLLAQGCDGGENKQNRQGQAWHEGTNPHSLSHRVKRTPLCVLFCGIELALSSGIVQYCAEGIREQEELAGPRLATDRMVLKVRPTAIARTQPSSKSAVQYVGVRLMAHTVLEGCAGGRGPRARATAARAPLCRRCAWASGRLRLSPVWRMQPWPS